MSIMPMIKPCQQVPLLDLFAQYQTITPEIDQAISSVLRGSDFILGREVSLFEQEFAAYCGTRFAVGELDFLSRLVLCPNLRNFTGWMCRRHF